MSFKEQASTENVAQPQTHIATRAAYSTQQQILENAPPANKKVETALKSDTWLPLFVNLGTALKPGLKDPEVKRIIAAEVQTLANEIEASQTKTGATPAEKAPVAEITSYLTNANTNTYMVVLTGQYATVIATAEQHNEHQKAQQSLAESKKSGCDQKEVLNRTAEIGAKIADLTEAAWLARYGASLVADAALAGFSDAVLGRALQDWNQQFALHLQIQQEIQAQQTQQTMILLLRNIDDYVEDEKKRQEDAKKEDDKHDIYEGIEEESRLAKLMKGKLMNRLDIKDDDFQDAVVKTAAFQSKFAQDLEVSQPIEKWTAREKHLDNLKNLVPRKDGEAISAINAGTRKPKELSSYAPETRHFLVAAYRKALEDYEASLPRE